MLDRFQVYISESEEQLQEREEEYQRLVRQLEGSHAENGQLKSEMSLLTAKGGDNISRLQ